MPSIIAGLLAFALGLWGLSVWWYSVEELLRGLVPLLLLFFGMVALMAGVSRVTIAPKDSRSDEELIDLEEEVSDQKRASGNESVKPTQAAAKRKAVKKKAAEKSAATAAENDENTGE